MRPQWVGKENNTPTFGRNVGAAAPTHQERRSDWPPCASQVPRGARLSLTPSHTQHTIHNTQTHIKQHKAKHHTTQRNTHHNMHTHMHDTETHTLHHAHTHARHFFENLNAPHHAHTHTHTRTHTHTHVHACTRTCTCTRTRTTNPYRAVCMCSLCFLSSTVQPQIPTAAAKGRKGTQHCEGKQAPLDISLQGKAVV
jgi:hypothetical protein